jgi:CRP-like cAMP-binding protein
MDALEVLSRVELLKNIPLPNLVMLARKARHTTYQPGDQLVRHGKDDGMLRVIVSGRVRVERTHPELIDPVILADLGPAEIVGELAMPDGSFRSAVFIALETTEVFEFDAAVQNAIATFQPVQRKSGE